MDKVDGFDKTGYYSSEGADLLTLDEVCELLKVSKSYIYSLTHRQMIPHLKMFGFLRFRRSAIEEWLRDKEVANADT